MPDLQIISWVKVSKIEVNVIHSLNFLLFIIHSNIPILTMIYIVLTSSSQAKYANRALTLRWLTSQGELNESYGFLPDICDWPTVSCRPVALPVLWCGQFIASCLASLGGRCEQYYSASRKDVKYVV